VGQRIICHICGAVVEDANPLRKYCDGCRGKGAFMRREDRYKRMSPSIQHQRRRAIQDGKSERRNGRSDRYLTWRSIWDANRGRCYLCGKPCDPKDCGWKNGGFVTGWRYPTLDHLVPIMRGGRHEPDNVRLAHKWCNTIKHDHTVEEVLSPEWEAAFRNMPKARARRKRSLPQQITPNGGEPCPSS